MVSQVSIVIPIYNNSATLGETLDSLLAQTDNGWECVLVDDGSTDSSIEIAVDYCQKDDRFKLLMREEVDPKLPKGANSCRNIGLEQASTPFVIFLDADDLLLADAIRDRLTAFEKYSEYDALIFSFRSLSEAGVAESIGNYDPDHESELEYLKAFLSYRIPWQTSCPIWKREFISSQGGFDLNFRRFQDVEFHSRMLLNGSKVKRVYQDDLRYRINTKESKYQQSDFLNVITEAINAYLFKFGKAHADGIMSRTERLPYLRKMSLRLIDNFLLPQREWERIQQTVQTSKRTGIFNASQARATKIYCWLQRTKKYKQKGFGMYRLYSWSRSVSGLKTEVS